MTKMTDAFKKLFLDLGGNPKELAENNDVGDYILDLEGAIKEYVGDKTEDLIDDTDASSTKTYSSTKIESLIPANELPTPAVADIGKVVSVVSDGDEGAEYDLTTPASDTIYIQFTYDELNEKPVVPEGITFSVVCDYINNGKKVIFYMEETVSGSKIKKYFPLTRTTTLNNGNISQVVFSFSGLNSNSTKMQFVFFTNGFGTNPWVLNTYEIAIS